MLMQWKCTNCETSETPTARNSFSPRVSPLPRAPRSFSRPIFSMHVSRRLKKLFSFLQCFLDCQCSYGSDVTKMSLEALSSLATHCFLEIQKNVKVPTHEILQHFLKVRNISKFRRSVMLHSPSSPKQFVWVPCAGYLLSKCFSQFELVGPFS